MFYLSIIKESFTQAMQELVNNKLRAFLSLLGISIGIFCIIAVLSAVDSLKESIISSFEKLGNDVIYVDNSPWAEDPGQNYWKYVKWPEPDYDDFEAIQTQMGDISSSSFAIFMPGKTLKYRNSSVEGLFMVGATFEYDKIFNLTFSEGRYFTPFEYQNGDNKIILGYGVKDNLFGETDAVGRYIKMMGRKFQVIGVLEEEGESLINVFPLDEALIMGYNTARKLINMESGVFGASLAIKPAPVFTRDMDFFRGEVTGALRANRGISPAENNNFVLNELTMIANALEGFFSVLNTAGFFIGIFAILVGMFSVANIMFVSVKERTNIIGIKKALGARQIVILLEFLIESVVLCIIGGILGLALVFLVMLLLDHLLDFDFFLSYFNIMLGVGLSVVIGILSGLIPALQAARMDPVEAIRA